MYLRPSSDVESLSVTTYDVYTLKNRFIMKPVSKGRTVEICYGYSELKRV